MPTDPNLLVSQDQIAEEAGLPEAVHADLEAFLNYWHSKRGPRLMPARDDIRPEEIRRLLPGICLLDLDYRAGHLERLRFRLAGTALYDMIGRDVTGLCLHDIIPPPVYRRVRHQFTQIIADGRPRYRRITWPRGPRPHVVYERILAPLGPPDGAPTMFIGMHAIVDNARPWRSGPEGEPVPLG